MLGTASAAPSSDLIIPSSSSDGFGHHPPAAAVASHLKLPRKRSKLFSRNTLMVCSSSTGPAGSSDEERVESSVTSFFLGKALAEALCDRMDLLLTKVGIISPNAHKQQQNQFQDFQGSLGEELLERARRGRERAREALEDQGILPKSSPSADASTTTMWDDDGATGSEIDATNNQE